MGEENIEENRYLVLGGPMNGPVSHRTVIQAKIEDGGCSPSGEEDDDVSSRPRTSLPPLVLSWRFAAP